jgi:hypothetical protein
VSPAATLPNRLPTRLACALALSCAACGGGGSSLEGSLGAEVPLDFTAVVVELSSTPTIAIRYNKDRPDGGAPDMVLKITANATGLPLTGPLTIDLTEKVGTETRGGASRAVSGDGRSNFPTLLRGSMTLAQAPTVGSKISGSFTVTFNNTGGSLGAGKTAFGNFEAVLKAAGQ